MLSIRHQATFPGTRPGRARAHVMYVVGASVSDAVANAVEHFPSCKKCSHAILPSSARLCFTPRLEPQPETCTGWFNLYGLVFFRPKVHAVFPNQSMRFCTHTSCAGPCENVERPCVSVFSRLKRFQGILETLAWLDPILSAHEKQKHTFSRNFGRCAEFQGLSLKSSMASLTLWLDSMYLVIYVCVLVCCVIYVCMVVSVVDRFSTLNMTAFWSYAVKPSIICRIGFRHGLENLEVALVRKKTWTRCMVPSYGNA